MTNTYKWPTVPAGHVYRDPNGKEMAVVLSDNEKDQYGVPNGLYYLPYPPRRDLNPDWIYRLTMPPKRILYDNGKYAGHTYTTASSDTFLVYDGSRFTWTR